MEHIEKILKTYNISLFDEQKNIKEANVVISELGKIWESLSPIEQHELSRLFITEDGHNGIIGL